MHATDIQAASRPSMSCVVANHLPTFLAFWQNTYIEGGSVRTLSETTLFYRGPGTAPLSTQPDAAGDKLLGQARAQGQALGDLLVRQRFGIAQ